MHYELRRLAAAYMRREGGDHTLQTTALVDEACLRLVGQRDIAYRTLGVSSKTENRDWLVARARLHGEIAGRR